MKKHYYLYAIVILTLVAVMPLSARAEDGDGAPVPALLREQLRGRAENIQNNIEIRNKILENRRIGTSTRPGLASTTRMERKEIRDDRREDVRDIRREGREDIRNASSSSERREIRRDMRKDVFAIRKEALIKQLSVSLNNLKQIRERIASRIEKASAAGRDMTNAKSALVTADAKIQAAITAIEALKSFVPPTATSTATTTDSTIDLNKPRQIGDTAIKAIKAAHESLVAVVRAIAHAMGLGDSATTTPTTTTPGTGDNSSATSTATTTTP